MQQVDSAEIVQAEREAKAVKPAVGSSGMHEEIRDYVELTHDELDVNDKVIERLSKLKAIYEYCGSLIQIQNGRVHKYTLATLRELIANTVYFVNELSEDDRGKLCTGELDLEEQRQRPPKWSYEAILSRGLPTRAFMGRLASR